MFPLCRTNDDWGMYLVLGLQGAKIPNALTAVVEVKLPDDIKAIMYIGIRWAVMMMNPSCQEVQTLPPSNPGLLQTYHQQSQLMKWRTSFTDRTARLRFPLYSTISCVQNARMSSHLPCGPESMREFLAVRDRQHVLTAEKHSSSRRILCDIEEVMMLHHPAHHSSARAMLLVLKRSHSHVHAARRLTHGRILFCAILAAPTKREYIGAVPAITSLATAHWQRPSKCLTTMSRWIDISFCSLQLCTSPP